MALGVTQPLVSLVLNTRRRLQLIAFLAVIGGYFPISLSNAQTPLTVESLIGKSVSLSNRSYPEVESAIQRFRNRDVQGAREFLEIAGKKYPKLPPFEVTLAKMYSAARDGQRMHLMLELAVKNHPKDPEAYLIMADRAFIAGRITESELLFEKASKLAPDFKNNEKRKRDFSIRVLAGGAAVAERRQQWERAQGFLREWIEAKPDSDIAHQRMGNTLFQLEKLTEAIQEFKKARQINPDAVHPSVAMGRLFSQRGDVENARKNFVQAHQEDKDNETTSQVYVEWLLQQGETDAARKVAKDLRDIKSDSPSAWLLDAIVAAIGEDFAQAEKSLTKVLSIDHSNASATNLLALILIRGDNVAQQERALSYAKVNAERFPQSSQANITLGWVLYKLERLKEAEVALQRGASAGKRSPDSTYLIAKIMAEQGQVKKAVALLQKLVASKDGFFMHRKDAEKLLVKLESEAKQQ